MKTDLFESCEDLPVEPPTGSIYYILQIYINSAMTETLRHRWEFIRWYAKRRGWRGWYVERQSPDYVRIIHTSKDISICACLDEKELVERVVDNYYVLNALRRVWRLPKTTDINTYRKLLALDDFRRAVLLAHIKSKNHKENLCPAF